MINHHTRPARAVSALVLLFLLLAFPRTGATAQWIVIAPAEYAAEFQPWPIFARPRV